MSLRIGSLETFPIGLPFERPYVTATGTLERREMIIVRLRSEDGATGYGDAVPMSLRGGPGLDTVRSDLADICAPLLRRTSTSAPTRCDRSPRLWPAAADGGAGAQALSAVDIALLDLIGQSTRTCRPGDCSVPRGPNPWSATAPSEPTSRHRRPRQRQRCAARASARSR